MVLPAVPQDAGKSSGTAPGLRERKRERTRQAILDAAWLLFTRDGVSNTSIRSVAELAEVSDVTLYSYFNTRAQLIDTLMSRHASMERTVTALAERPADEGPVEALRGIGEYQRDLSKAEFARQVKILRLINGDPVLRGAYRQNQTHYIRTLIDALLPRAEAVGMPASDLELLCFAYQGAIDHLSDDDSVLTGPGAWADATEHALNLLDKGWGRRSR
ncbi:TetR/AcrR family transcriptional regulator [Streptomyces sp. 150FB]|uniref:TetR/AcrR family transcriptional regulator n=1 Tax=Streptomyces sp. 150FB TaxID=1576605 RepID=UPI000696CE14|nr:TetR/AcrR family transcriptional regulator [Streptomyces sp. 150FB]